MSNIRITNHYRPTQSFTILNHEMPDTFPVELAARLNHIEYMGGNFVTNQLVGIYDGPLTWEGMMWGEYPANADGDSALDRAKKLQSMVGLIVDVDFYASDFEWHSSDLDLLYYLERCPISIKNKAKVLYTINLVPHIDAKKLTLTGAKQLSLAGNFKSVTNMINMGNIIKSKAQQVVGVKAPPPRGRGQAPQQAQPAKPYTGAQDFFSTLSSEEGTVRFYSDKIPSRQRKTR